MTGMTANEVDAIESAVDRYVSESSTQESGPGLPKGYINPASPVGYSRTLAHHHVSQRWTLRGLSFSFVLMTVIDTPAPSSTIPPTAPEDAWTPTTQ